MFNRSMVDRCINIGVELDGLELNNTNNNLISFFFFEFEFEFRVEMTSIHCDSEDYLI